MVVEVGAGEPPVERGGGGVVAGLERGRAASARASRSAKSAGLMTLRWMIENTISIWLSQEAWIGRCTSRRSATPACIRSIERCPLWRRAVVDDPVHPPRRGVGLGGHHLVDQVAERHDPGLVGDRADQPGPVDVVGAHVGEGAAPLVLELHPPTPPGPGGERGMAAAQRLQLGLLVGGDHVVVIAERHTAPDAGVQVQHPGRLGGEVGVPGEDPRPVPPRLDRVVVQPAPHRR